MRGKRHRGTNPRGSKANQGLPRNLRTPQHNNPPPEPPERSRKQSLSPESPRRKIAKNATTQVPAFWTRGWKLLLEVAAVLGLLLAVYAYRPILQVTSIGSPPPHADNVWLTITSSGFPISNVSVECVTTKVIMANEYTLELHRVAALDQYDVPEVKTGESFNVQCPLAWYLLQGGGLGYYIWGRPILFSPQMGIPFRLTTGLPVATTNGRPMAITFSDLAGYQVFPPTAVEGIVIVHFKWKHTPFRQTKSFHTIGRRDGKGQFSWGSVPESQEAIPDADGLKLTVDQSSQRFAFQMKHSR